MPRQRTCSWPSPESARHAQSFARLPVRAVVRALAASVAIYYSDGPAFACQAGKVGATRGTSTPPVDVAARAPAEATPPPFRVYISDARVGIAAVQALHLAAARLARPNCQGNPPRVHRRHWKAARGQACCDAGVSRGLPAPDGPCRWEWASSMHGHGCPGFHDAGQSRRVSLWHIVRDEASGQPHGSDAHDHPRTAPFAGARREPAIHGSDLATCPATLLVSGALSQDTALETRAAAISVGRGDEPRTTFRQCPVRSISVQVPQASGPCLESSPLTRANSARRARVKAHCGHRTEAVQHPATTACETSRVWSAPP